MFTIVQERSHFNMAYYAQILDNIVTEVIVVNDDITDGAQFAHNLLGGEWVQTFEDTDGKTYAGIGFTYDPITQDFTAPYVEPVWPIEPDNETPTP